MKSLFLNTYYKKGGAAIAANRLLKGIKDHAGCEVLMYVNHKSETPYYIKSPETKYEKLEAFFRNPAEELTLFPYSKRKQVIFSSAMLPNYNLFRKINGFNPDIVHLHWINSGFFRLEQLINIKKPVIWTLHDMWSFTGGCHYSSECFKYTSHCGNCPVLNSGKQRDLAYKNFKRKQNVFEKLDLTIVCVSSWLGNCAKNSELLGNKRILVIKNGIDSDLFKPVDKITARDILNLPRDKKLILFGALNSLSDERKGYKYLYESLKIIEKEYSKNSEIVIFGDEKPQNPVKTGFKVNYTGILKDETALSLLYSACDVMIVPSVQESFGQTASEAMACATPVIAFGITGLLDIVDHRLNGYLAKPYEPEEIAQGIKWILSLDHDEYNRVSARARRKAEENFDIKLISRKYYDLYTEILGK